MAIRFSCASCKQPLEVDDAWAGQAVACPYCRNVVTAPSTSTWPTGEVPMASPAAPQAGFGFGPPPPPFGQTPIGPSTQAYAVPRPPGGSQAVGAFVLSLVGTLLAIAGYLTWFAPVSLAVLEKLGPNAPPERQQALFQELAFSEQFHEARTWAIPIYAAGIFCGVAGAVMAIRSLLRAESRRGLAIAACVLGACVTLCQVLPMLSALMIRSGTHAGG